MLADYVSPAIATALKAHLKIEEEETKPIVVDRKTSVKGGGEPTENYADGDQNVAPAKKAKLTAKQAQLAKASRGSTALTSFFAKK